MLMAVYSLFIIRFYYFSMYIYDIESTPLHAEWQRYICRYILQVC